MLSPIAQIRKNSRLSQHDFAIFAGVGISTLVATESGALRPNERILKALEELGADSEGIKNAHNRFVEAKRKAMSVRLRVAS
jgi:DNA-binding transcriptional regulator YiaG